MKKVLLIVAILSSYFLNAQSFNLDGAPGIQNIVTCGGNFFDTGGEGNETDVVNFYQGGENDTITFCPDYPGKKLRFIVTKFNLEINDFIEVFDGSPATTFNRIGVYGQDGLGFGLMPNDTIQASTSNSSGCITFVFKSDLDTKQNLGWEFKISCFVPCQDIVGVGTFNNVAAEDSIFHLCKNDIIDLAGFGIYPDMGTPSQLYTQTNPLSIFTWKIFGPAGQQTSTTETGTYNPGTGFSEASHTFADSGIYHIILEIQDTLTEFECKNKNYVHNIVYVSGPPVFISDETPKDSTLAEFPIICLGDTNYLIGIVDTVFHIDDCKPKPVPIKIIPDGQEEGGLRTVEMEAEFKCYGKQVIDDVADIQNICLDIEHSAIGDLEMSVTCPSGQTVRFLTPNIGANANLGILNLTGTAQGTVDTYCFNMGGSQTLNDVAADPSMNTGIYIAGGTFLPLDDLSNFIGCRINGKWVLSIKDSRINDNGFAGNWKINFDPSIQPVSDTLFYNTYVDSNWIEDGTNPSLGINLTPLSKGDTLAVLPTLPGAYKYTFQVRDDFGCTYDTIVNFQVIDRKQADFTYLGDTVYCEGETGTLTPTFLPGFNNVMGQAGIFTVAPAGLTVNGTTGVITIDGTTLPGQYTITNTVTTNPGGCVDEHTFSSTILIMPKPQPTILGAGNYCQTDTLTIQPGATDNAYASFSWSNGSTNDSIFATSANNPITVTVTDVNGCIGTSPAVTVTALAQQQHTATITICEGASATIHGQVQTQPGVYSQLFSTGQTSCDSVSTITLQFYPRVNIGPDVTICENSCTDLTASLPDMTNSNFTWSNGVFGATQNVCPIINTNYSVTATDGNGCVTRDTVTVFVNPTRDIALTYSAGTICINSPSPTATFNAQAGYLFTSNPAGVDPVTGLLSPAQTAVPGTYVITYSDGIYQCNINNTASITVTNTPDATFSFGTVCVPGTSACPTFPSGASAGMFTFTDPTTTGIVMNSLSGCIDLTATNSGTYSITNTIAASGVCPAVSHTASITVNDKPIVTGTASNTNFCVGLCTTLTGSSNSSNPMSYTWDNSVTDNVQFCPPTSQTYTVTGTDQVTGCSNSAIVSVVVNQLPVIDPMVGQTICRGASVTISAFSPNSITENVSYDWDNGLGSGTTKVVTPNNTTTYIVTVTNNTTLCLNTSPVTITVNQPIIDAGADQAICFGAQATLNASGAASYTWSPAGDLSNSTIANPVTNITDDQTFSVTGTDVNGCTFTDFVTVTVNDLPNVTATANPTAVCAGLPVTITAAGAVSYTANGLAFTSPATSSTTYPTTISGGVEMVLVDGTDANGCHGTFNVPITVNPIPDIIANADMTVCAGTVVTLFASGTPVISWAGPTTVTNGTSFIANNTGTYTATGIDANGCVGTEQVNIVVNPLPAVVGNASDLTPCEGDLVTFTGSGAGAGATYTWSNGIGANPASVNVTSITSTYVVTGIDANGCINSDDVVITVNPRPQILVEAKDSTICIGNTASIFVEPNVAGSTYSWSPVGSGASFDDVPTSVGIIKYIVVVTDVNGCTATDDLDITVVNNDVTASLSAVENSNVVNDNVLYPGDPVTYVNGSTNANYYIWDLKDGNGLYGTNSSGDQSASYLDTGTYYIYLQATNQQTGCQDDTVIAILVVPFDGAIVCNPNIFTPDGDKVNDEFYVDICYGLIESLNVVVYNRWGNEITSMTGKFDPKDPKTYWDGTQDGKPVSEGVYFYTFEAIGKNGDVVKGHDNVQVVRKK